LSLKLLFFAAGVLVSLAVGELLLRHFPAFQPQPTAYPGEQADRESATFASDPQLGWRLRPGHEFVVETDEYRVRYRANDHGFRDERSPEAAPRRRNVALVGDSFAFGQGVPFEQTLGALLESRLSDTAVHNLALPGYGLDQMWQTVRVVALPMQPALVIVSFISEDFGRSFSAYRPDIGLSKPVFGLRGSELRRLAADDAPHPWLRLLERHSRIWMGVRQARRLLALHLGVGEWWELNRAILDAIRADCQAAGRRVLFVHLPTRELRTFRALAAYMERVGADFVDLGNHELPTPGALHYAVDGHPNPAGHRYVADAVLAWIAREMPELE
jgi:hypothetical protein